MTSPEDRVLIESIRALATGADPQRDTLVMDAARAIEAAIRAGAHRQASETSAMWHIVALLMRRQGEHSARHRASEAAIQILSDRVTALEAAGEPS